MRGDTIRDVKKRLAAAFPEVEFTYGMGGRGRQRGPNVRWTGGPPAKTVWQAAAWWPSWRNPRPLHLDREMTEAEREVWRAEQDREHAEWVAAAPARETARKAAAADPARAQAGRAGGAGADDSARDRPAMAGLRRPRVPPQPPVRATPTPYRPAEESKAMTEKEAKTKWCPWARNISADDGDFARNRYRSGEPLEGARCLGSGCMAWRLQQSAPKGHGYCGLAADGGSAL